MSNLAKARSLFKQQRFEEAIHMYGQHLNEDSWDYQAATEMGCAFYLNGNIENSIGCYYLATHVMITLKLHKQGFSNAPSADLERRKLCLIHEEAPLHLAMAIITLNPNYQQAMRQFSSNPMGEVAKYKNWLLGNGLQDNEVFLRNCYNIGGNFFHQGLVWDLVGKTDADSLLTSMYVYNRIGFLKNAA